MPFTIKVHESRFDPSQYDYFKVHYIIDGEPYFKNTNGIVDARGTLEMALRHGATTATLYGIKDTTETEIPLKDIGIEKKSEFYMDGDDSEDYYYCHRCGRVTPSYELDAHGGFCSDCDARWTAEHENESKDTDEKLGYEKGHKNSKGEDAPWVIRSHKDSRVLASFPTKKEAEDQMQRMKQYSKTESKQNEMNNHELTAAVQKAADSAGAKVKIEPAGAMFLEVYMENKNHVLERAWYVDEVEQTITPFEFNFETTEWNTGDTKSYSNSDELTAVMTDFFKDAQSELFEANKSEAHDLKNYTSDIISELDVIWACGTNGAKRLADKYADVIQQNYTDGDLSAAETAKFIAGQENLTESRKKTESKQSEVHLELIDTIIVPKWLWEAHTFGNEYGEDLDEHEQEILAKFEEEYGKQYYLDDRSEEADFRSRNDFDEYGGPCYEVDVYKMS